MEKHLQECLARRSAAAEALSEVESGVAAEEVTHSLVYGLNTLRNLVFTRIHDDVEAQVGHDSMLLPISVEQSEHAAKCEIEAYQLVVSAMAIGERGYVTSNLKWVVRWLGDLRLGEEFQQSRWRRRIRHYLAMSDDEQRLAFSRNLETVFPEASRAPLILYRLFPLAVRIVAAVAFNHHLDAAELRNRQTLWLPAVGDCHECHGRPLDNGDQCAVCGNPMWSYGWLCAD